jgi:ethanolamine permease
MFTIATTAILVFFVSVSLPPGIASMSANEVPFNTGFQLIFTLSNEQTLQYATILSIPAIFTSIFGFTLMYGKSIYSLSCSQLLPLSHLLTKRLERFNSPYVALITGSLISYGILLISYFYTDLSTSLYNIAIFSAFITYISECTCHLIFRTKFNNFQRDFRSPFGIYGSIFSICIWSLGVISIIGFQKDNQRALIITVIIYSIYTLWYFVYAKSHQVFSDEERDAFFKIYVINGTLFVSFIQIRYLTWKL